MRRLFLPIVALAVFSAAAQAQYDSNQVRKVASLPATCTVNSTNAVVYQGMTYHCTATNTWSNVTGTVTDATATVSGKAKLGQLPTSTYAGLPTCAAGNDGQMYRVTDANRDVYSCYGSAAKWVSRNGGVYNVRDFGAVGNNSANDTVAIQAAITAAQTAGYTKVYVPSGTYLVTMAATGRLALTGSNVTIEGDGPSSIISWYDSPATSSTNIQGTLNIYGSAGNNLTNVVIRKLHILGTRSKTYGFQQYEKGIIARYVTNYTVEDCVVEKAGGEAIALIGEDNVNVTFLRNFVTNGAHNALNFNGTLIKGRILDNTIIDNWSGIDAIGHDVLISGNRLTDIYENNAIQMQSGGSQTIENALISNNTIKTITTNTVAAGAIGAINITDAFGLAITDLTIDGNTVFDFANDGIDLTLNNASSKRIRVTGNTISSTGTASGGAQLRWSGLRDSYVANNTILGNSVSYYGMAIGTNVTSTYVSGNLIKGHTSADIINVDYASFGSHPAPSGQVIKDHTATVVPMPFNVSGSLLLSGGISTFTTAFALPNVTVTAGAGASLSLNLSTGNIRTVTFGAGNITSLTATSIPIGPVWIGFIQDSTGSRIVTAWNSLFLFAGGTKPTLSTAANSRDQFQFLCDGTNCILQSALYDVK